jgi:hypothetical protein
MYELNYERSSAYAGDPQEEEAPEAVRECVRTISNPTRTAFTSITTRMYKQA